MQVTCVHSIPIPKAQLPRPEPRQDPNVPGLILPIDPKFLAPSLSGLNASGGLLGIPTAQPARLAVQPQHVPLLFKHYEDVALLKKAAALVLAKIDPRLKTGADVLWLGVGIAKLAYDWQNGEKAAGLVLKTSKTALSAAKLVGSIDGSFQLPHETAAGLEWGLQTATAFHSGKFDVMEQLAAQDPATELFLSLPKVIARLADSVNTNSKIVPRFAPVSPISKLATKP